jgi:tRNA threonylcarbamoyladenosine biosynthesis protein TsaB
MEKGPVNSLVIDASTYRGTVAVFRDRIVASSMHATMRGVHSEALMPAVAEALSQAGMKVGDLSRVVCGEGPGSFTSLRIAGSIAKGLCMGLDIPLFAVSSLGLAAASSSARGTFVVTIDALRDEWYAGIFERNAAGAVSTRAQFAIVPKTEIEAFAAGIGPIVADAEPDAGSCALLFDEIEAMGPVDLDRWEPSYGRLAEAQVKWEASHGRPLK